MSVYLHSILSAGPFVYRLGRKIFILERGVRLSYGLRNGTPTRTEKDDGR